jgi:hypothetical protein
MSITLTGSQQMNIRMVLSALAENDFKEQFQLLKQHFESFGKGASVADQVREIKSFTVKTPQKTKKGQQKRNSEEQISRGLRNHPAHLILKGAP